MGPLTLDSSHRGQERSNGFDSYAEISIPLDQNGSI
jgi:hypothetical protein